MARCLKTYVTICTTATPRFGHLDILMSLVLLPLLSAQSPLRGSCSHSVSGEINEQHIYLLHTIYSAEFTRFAQFTPLNFPASRNILSLIYPLHAIFLAEFTRFTQYTPLNLAASRNILHGIYPLHTVHSAEFARFTQHSSRNLPASHSTLR